MHFIRHRTTLTTGMYGGGMLMISGISAVTDFDSFKSQWWTPMDIKAFKNNNKNAFIDRGKFVEASIATVIWTSTTFRPCGQARRPTHSCVFVKYCVYSECNLRCNFMSTSSVLKRFKLPQISKMSKTSGRAHANDRLLIHIGFGLQLLIA